MPPEPDYWAQIYEAIYKRAKLSFHYSRADGTITLHNAVYPRQLFRWRGKQYLRAYCYFPADIRVFRLDRMSSLQVLAPTLPPTRTEKLVGLVGAVLIVVLVFTGLVLFSEKSAWRGLRKWFASQFGVH
ncbi:MAG: helix-turn-helix transcriptional regulator [Terriglobia bacterium]